MIGQGFGVADGHEKARCRRGSRQPTGAVVITAGQEAMASRAERPCLRRGWAQPNDQSATLLPVRGTAPAEGGPRKGVVVHSCGPTHPARAQDLPEQAAAAPQWMPCAGHCHLETGRLGIRLQRKPLLGTHGTSARGPIQPAPRRSLEQAGCGNQTY